jgi:tetratricopeptide (TPR) repeat protein
LSGTIDICRVAYESAEGSGDEVLLAELARDVGDKLGRLGDFDGSERSTSRALRIFQSLGDAVGESNTYRNLAALQYVREDQAGARELAERGIDAARRSGRPDILTWALLAYNDMVDRTGDLDTDLVLIKETMEQAQLAGLTYVIPTICLSVANTYFHHRGFVEAREWALSGRSALGDLPDPGIAVGLAAVAAAAGSELGYLDEVAAEVAEYDRLAQLHPSIIAELAELDDARYAILIQGARAVARPEQ